MIPSHESGSAEVGRREGAGAECQKAHEALVGTDAPAKNGTPAAAATRSPPLPPSLRLVHHQPRAGCSTTQHVHARKAIAHTTQHVPE